MILKLAITGMTCVDCARAIEAGLRAIEGVRQARVAYPAATAEVDLDAPATPEGVVAAVRALGYGATVPERRAAGPAVVDAPHDYDVLILGTGSGGMAAAITASELGYRAGIVERGTIGGTCVNVGCIPSKALIQAADRYFEAGQPLFPGVSTGQGALDFAAVIAGKRAIVEMLRQEKYVDVLATYEGVTLLHDTARFTGPTTVEVDGRPLTARAVIVATGAHPAIPPIPGLEAAGYLTSTTLMELEELPRSLLVLGGGSVGLEAAQTFARLGSRVTVLEVLPHVLPAEHPPLADALAGFLREEGIEIVTEAQVTAVRREGTETVVTGRVGGEERTVRAAALLVATGRLPNTADLNLEAAGVRTDRRGAIVVDETLRTSSPAVYAVGDVTTLPQFVYVAAAAGGLAVKNALQGAGQRFDLHAVPRVTFTSPQLAAVGLSEEQARAQGYRPVVSELPVAYIPRAIVNRDTRGTVRLIADEATERLLGAQILAPQGAELLAEATLAVRLGLTISDITDTMHAYLTMTEGLKLAAQGFRKDVARLSCCAA